MSTAFTAETYQHANEEMIETRGSWLASRLH